MNEPEKVTLNNLSIYFNMSVTFLPAKATTREKREREREKERERVRERE